MDNLLALSRLYCFGPLILAVVGLILCFVYAQKDIKVEKGTPIILVLGIGYTLWVGSPYIADCVTQKTQTINGQVIEVKTSTHKLSRTVYSYTLQGADGEAVVVYVAESHLDELKMEDGVDYEVTYFNNSKSVKTVERTTNS